MSDIEVNPYVLLEVKVESTEQEIRTAYRQRSLKVHPDRVSTLLLIFLSLIV
jgi:DnaJ family protein C protein 17